MDTISAFAMNRAAIAAGNVGKVFDWIKAAQIIRDRKPTEAVAGLSADMEWTAGTIYRDGKPVPSDESPTYLSSTWATPVLVLDDGEEIPCFLPKPDAPGWDSDTSWPPEAIAELTKSTT